MGTACQKVLEKYPRWRRTLSSVATSMASLAKTRPHRCRSCTAAWRFRSAEIVHVLCHLRAFLDTDISRIGDASENGDDGYYDQQFEQGETAREISSHS